jgi:hypothetical protein
MQECLAIAITPIAGATAIRMFLAVIPTQEESVLMIPKSFTSNNATATMVNNLLFGVSFLWNRKGRRESPK